MKRITKRTPEEALRASVDALDGLQAVGATLRTDIDPVLAGQWLSHCLTATKRDKLALTQIVRIFREAAARDYDELANRPELLARMRAANVKVTP